MPERAHYIEAIAHRGVRDRYPENSLPAFMAALDAGADGVELDVHATADDVVVVHHDANLAPDVASRFAGRSIRTLTSDQLAQFELAPGVAVPTLEDAVQAVAPNGKVYIEIKAPNIEALVADVIARVPGAATACCIHSFDHRIARNVATLLPTVPTGILLVGYPVDATSLLRAAKARDLWESYEFIDDPLVAAIHAAGGRTIAWTCDEPQDWNRLRALGVDGICTNRVGALVTHLKTTTTKPGQRSQEPR
jgi:glycerophosphoryl diester phosphodiesterase